MRPEVPLAAWVSYLWIQISSWVEQSQMYIWRELVMYSSFYKYKRNAQLEQYNIWTTSCHRGWLVPFGNNFIFIFQW